MSCPFETEVLLLRDADGAPARRIVVEAHLAVCDRCARIDETLEILGERLRAGDCAPLGVIEGVALPPRRRMWPVAAAAAALLAVVWLAWPAPPVLVPVAKGPALPPSPPTLPPPGPARGPALATLVAALDPAAGDYATQVADVAARVRADGAFGSSALAALLLADDPRCALDVSVLAPSPVLAVPLAALLDRPDFAETAARALGAAGASKALVAALDGPASAHALEALVSIGGREVALALERRCEDEETLDALARVDPARAARVLAMGGAPGAQVLARRRERLVPELRRLLSDGKAAAGAARRLGEAGDTGSVEDLVRLAGRPTTAQGATEGLLALGAVEAAFRAARRLPEASAAFDGARRAEPFLLDRIGLGPHAERRAALELLGRCGGEATVRRLASKPVARNLRDATAATLGAIGGEEAIVALHRMGRDRALRRDVVRALGATGDARALPVLGGFLDDDGLAGELAAALARIHDPASVAMLADLALRGSGSEQAARALTAMPAAIVVPVLLERLGGHGRTRELLVRIAGADHGPRRETWKQWWDSRP